MSTNKIIMSVDPGIYNNAFCAVEFYTERIVYLEKHSMFETRANYKTTQFSAPLLQMMNRLRHVFDRCTHFVIEHQMHRKTDIIAHQMQTWCNIMYPHIQVSYCSPSNKQKLPEVKTHLEKLVEKRLENIEKTEVCSTKMYNLRKKATTMGMEELMCTVYKDHVQLQQVWKDAKSKKDDLADAYMQALFQSRKIIQGEIDQSRKEAKRAIKDAKRAKKNACTSYKRAMAAKKKSKPDAQNLYNTAKSMYDVAIEKAAAAKKAVCITNDIVRTTHKLKKRKINYDAGDVIHAKRCRPDQCTLVHSDTTLHNK